MARYKQITFRVDEFERQAIQQAAENDQRREGDFVRLLVLNHIGYKAPVSHPDYSAPRAPQKPKKKEEQQSVEPEVTEYTEEDYADEEYDMAPPVAAPTSPCRHCGHPHGAHMSNPDLGARCMICGPTEDSVHEYEES